MKTKHWKSYSQSNRVFLLLKLNLKNIILSNIHDGENYLLTHLHLYFRDCTHSQGKTCKGDAVNFGGWDEFSKKNGIFEFPKGW